MRAALAAAAIAAIAIAVVLAVRSGSSPSVAVDAGVAREVARGTAADPPRPRDQGPDWRRDLPALAPVVDRVRLEKDEACLGEQILVSVDAHTDNHGEDAFLHGAIDGHAGLTVPVVVQKRADGTVARPQIVIEGRGGAAPVVIEGPEVKIASCSVDYRVLIATRERTNTVDEYDLQAEVAAGAYAAPFTPVTYRWSFGDGATAETTAATATHGYGARPQDRLYSDFVVGVEAVDAAGKVARGRITLSLRNPAFEQLARTGEVLLLAEITPRFGEVGPDGAIRQQVRVWHHQAGVVALDSVTVQTIHRDGSPAPEPEEQDPGAAIGIDAVPPDGVTFELALDAAQVAKVASRVVRLHGYDAHGHVAVGTVVQLTQPGIDPPLEEDRGPPPIAPEDDPTDPGGPRRPSGPEGAADDRGR